MFSRTITMSMSPGLTFASGVGTPGSSLVGRRLMYWSSSNRILSRMSVSISPCGIFALPRGSAPTAPNRIASCGAELLQGRVGQRDAGLEVVLGAERVVGGACR